MTGTLSNKFKLWPWAWFATTLFAGVFVWEAGHRGIYLLDQSIMFDGAWRVFQGQVPYRDFYTAFPPVPFFIQSLMFLIAGVDFSAMVLSAAMLNVVATVCVMWLVGRLLQAQLMMALIAGLLTAVWFQAPFGTLWFEQTAFLFNLLALVLLVNAVWAEGRAELTLRVAAGLLLGVAMLSKQNAGVEFLPVAFGVAAIPNLSQLRKIVWAVLQTCAGVLLAFGIFAVWLWLFSSPSDFWHCYVVLTRQIGADRIRWGTTLLAMCLLAPTLPYIVVALGALFAAIERSRGVLTPNRRLICWIVLGCTVFQNLFKLHTENQAVNCLPYMGLIYGLSVGLLIDVFCNRPVDQLDRRPGPSRRIVYVLIGILLCVRPFYNGFSNSWNRSVQEFDTNTRFVALTQAPGLSRVKWGEPTVINDRTGTTLSRKDFEDLNAWLVAADSNFFVFPDSTMLYGLHHRVSPQPWLYFSIGHSFLKEELLRVDRVVVESLRRNNVRVILLEKDSWLGNQDLVQYMPQLQTWIRNDFEKFRDFGIYEVWTCRGFPRPTVAAR